MSVVMSPSSWKPRDNFISSRPAADASHSVKALSASYPALNVGYKCDLFLRVVKDVALQRGAELHFVLPRIPCEQMPEKTTLEP